MRCLPLYMCFMYQSCMTQITCVRTKHNPFQTYEDFKAARLLGFGASDMGSLLNEGDYSCKRRLFLERLGLFPGDESRLQHHVERGKFLEAPVADLYANRTGRVLRLIGTGYIKEFQFMRANADRLITSDERGHGVLEIKCPAEHMFRKIKKDGLPLAYILQLQWQMLCYGVSWGSFAVYWADGHELLHFDVPRDDVLIESMVEAAKREWQWLQVFQGFLTDDEPFTKAEQFYPDSAFPPALDPYAKACVKCPNYESCHAFAFEPGKVIDRAECTSPAAEYLALKSNIKASEERLDELKSDFNTYFRSHECDGIKANDYLIQRSERSRENLSSKVKEILTPEERALYVSNTTFEVITVKKKEAK